MKIDNGQWLCIFCLSSSECVGPHIPEEHSRSFYEFAYYAKEDHADAAVEAIEIYERENNIDLSELKTFVRHKVMDRDR
jgi:hypothetical protein